MQNLKSENYLILYAGKPSEGSKLSFNEIQLKPNMKTAICFFVTPSKTPNVYQNHYKTIQHQSTEHS